MKLLHPKIKLLGLIIIILNLVFLVSCITRQEIDLSKFKQFNPESQSIQLVSIDARDSSYQQIGDDYIKAIIANVAVRNTFSIDSQEAPYKAYLKIKETKFDRNLDSYYSLWLSFDIKDIDDTLILRIILVNSNKQSIQSSAYLYTMLEGVINTLSKSWVKKK